MNGTTLGRPNLIPPDRGGARNSPKGGKSPPSDNPAPGPTLAAKTAPKGSKLGQWDQCWRTFGHGEIEGLDSRQAMETLNFMSCKSLGKECIS